MVKLLTKMLKNSYGNRTEITRSTTISNVTLSRARLFHSPFSHPKFKPIHLNYDKGNGGKVNYKACSKKDRTLAKKPLFYILSTVPFKLVPSTGNTSFPTFLPPLECFLERIVCDDAHFPGSPRVKKKRPNFLNSSPTGTEGALRLLSAPSSRFWQQTAICVVSLWALVVELHPLNWARAQTVRRIYPTDRQTGRQADRQTGRRIDR
jgi:hypothetical protein